MSISHAVRSTSSRNCSIWIQLSAIFSWVICRSASRPCLVWRDRARSHIMSNALRASAIVRIA
ncbi:Uncharacterised protein [Mycobacterium tuberculosis]|nr:Uncharacterised protein [Mycobacterium tuberculosis]COY78874.1 Uncharacterised protein [Mycobacterium tuberculosis]